MKIKVRYLSKLGHTKAIAEAIAEGANVKAISILDDDMIIDKTDVLFLGGAPYANVMDKKLRQYALSLDNFLVKKVVLFTTSNWSRRTVNSLRKILEDKNILVEKEYFYSHMLKIGSRIDKAKEFGNKYSK